MPDTTGFDTLQERLVAQGVAVTRAAVVRHALQLLVPGLDVTTLPYREALDRLAAACLAEVERLDTATTEGEHA